MNFLTERLDALSYSPQSWSGIDWPLWYELWDINCEFAWLAQEFSKTSSDHPSDRWLFLSLIANMSDTDLNECFGLSEPNRPNHHV